MNLDMGEIEGNGKWKPGVIRKTINQSSLHLRIIIIKVIYNGNDDYLRNASTIMNSQCVLTPLYLLTVPQGISILQVRN